MSVIEKKSENLSGLWGCWLLSLLLWLGVFTIFWVAGGVPSVDKAQDSKSFLLKEHNLTLFIGFVYCSVLLKSILLNGDK